MMLGTYAGAKRRSVGELDNGGGGGGGDDHDDDEYGRASGATTTTATTITTRSRRQAKRDMYEKQFKQLLPTIIENLKELSPYESKACPVLNEKYMVWLDQQTENIYFQPKEEYHKKNGEKRTSINYSDYLFYFGGYYDDDALYYIAERAERIAEDVDVLAQIVERSKCFDSQLLQLLATYIESKGHLTIMVNMNSYYKTAVNRYETFDVRRHVFSDSSSSSSRSSSSSLSPTCFFVDIQHQFDYVRNRSENKLGICISTVDGSIRSIMIDDVQVKDIDILKKRVFVPGEGYWGKALKSILNQFLHDEGMKINNGFLEVHPLVLKVLPEGALAAYTSHEILFDENGNMRREFFVRGVKFKRNNDLSKLAEGGDQGGLTKHFLTELALNLFDGNPSRSLRVDSNFTPYLSLPSSSSSSSSSSEANQKFIFDKDVATCFGLLLSRLRSGECLGRVISDNFFQIFKIYLNYYEIARLDEEHGSTYNMEINKQILVDPDYKDILDYMDGDRSAKTIQKCIELMEHSGYFSAKQSALYFPLVNYEKKPCRVLPNVSVKNSPQKDLDSAIREFLAFKREPYMKMVQFCSEGIFGYAKDKIMRVSYTQSSELFQGVALSARDIISRITLNDEARYNAVIIEKVQFLQRYILEKASTAWLENLLLCVTGQRNLNAGTNIKIGVTAGVLCGAHTCTNTLDIPNTHATPPLTEMDVYSRFIQNLNITLAHSESFDVV